MPKHSRFASIALVVSIAVLLLATACSGGTSQPFSFENATTQPVTIRVDDRLRMLLQPGQTKSFNTPNNGGGRHVLAVDDNSVTRLDKVYSWDELKTMDFRLVIH